MNKKYKALASDTLAMTVGSFGSKILTFLIVPLYTAILSTEDYGIIELLSTTINLIFPILTLAICDATLRFALDGDEDKHSVLSNSLIIIAAASVLLLALTPLTLSLDSFIGEYWWYFLGSFVLKALHMCFENYIKGIGKTKLYAIQGIFYTFVFVATNLLFLLVLKLGIYGYLLSGIIANLLSIILMIIVGKIGKQVLVFSLDKMLLRRMLSYSMPMIITSIMWWINSSSDKYMLSAMIGISATGIYSVAHKIPTIISTVLGIFSQAWRLSAVSNYKEKDTVFYSNIYTYYIAFGSIICMGITLFSRPVSLFLFKNEFSVAWSLVPFLILAAFFEGKSGFLASIYIAEKKSKFLMVSTIIGAVLNIGLNYILIKTMGTVGAPIATMISFLIVWIVRAAFLNRFIRLDVSYMKITLSLCVMIGSAFYYSFDMPLKYLVYALSMLAVMAVYAKEFVNIFKVIKNKLFKRKGQVKKQ